MGPDPLGHFIQIAVKSIHRKRMSVREVRGGQTASFALKKIKRSQIRKGMVMVSPALNPQACWEFEGEILVLHHPTTISSRYQAMGRLSKSYKHFNIKLFIQIINLVIYFYSSLWEHKTDCFYSINVSRLFKNRR